MNVSKLSITGVSLLVFVAVACSSGTSGDGSVDANGVDGGSAVDDGAKPDAMTSPDAAGLLDGTLLDADAGAATCNSLAQTAPVPVREKVSAIPPAEGGTIVDGVYHLVREASLSGTGFDELNHITWRIMGSLMETNEQRVGKTSERRASYSISASGTDLTRAMTCSSYGPGVPVDPPKTSGYTATPMKLTLFFGSTNLFELERQP